MMFQTPPNGKLIEVSPRLFLWRPDRTTYRGYEITATECGRGPNRWMVIADGGVYACPRADDPKEFDVYFPTIEAAKAGIDRNETHWPRRVA